MCRCEDVTREDVNMRRCEDVYIICADVKKERNMRGCEGENMICVDVKMTGYEDEKRICVDVKMRCADVKMRGSTGEKMICVDVKMKGCEDEKMYHRPAPLERSDALGKNCAFQTFAAILSFANEG